MKIPERIGETTSYAMYRVEKLAEQVYHIDDQIDNPSSMYCLIGSEKVLWIDTSNKHEGYEKEPKSMEWVSMYSNANLIKTDFFEAKSTAYAKSTALVDDL